MGLMLTGVVVRWMSASELGHSGNGVLDSCDYEMV